MDNFFNIKNCERCGCELNGRTMSWFNNQTICTDKCGTEETQLKAKLRETRGMDFEGANICIEQIRMMVK